jgi:hypothetical protein
MTAARRRALVIVLILIAAGAMLATTLRQRPVAQPGKPELLLLTGLPLVFGDDFDPRQQGSPALATLSQRFRVRPIGTSSGDELARGRLLLMAQPPAQSPDDLVALNQWVRDGGRVLLLADPMLEWPSQRRLGDPLRAPIMFTDTGLLGHWGLRLDAPDHRGPMPRTLFGRRIIAASPGSLAGTCGIGEQGFVADCRIGNGRAVVVADADLLNVPAGAPELKAVTDLLAWLSRNDSQRTDLSTGVRVRTS